MIFIVRKNKFAGPFTPGLLFCAAQSLSESVIAFLIIYTIHRSDINFEGALLYAFIRFVLTIGPYIVAFWVVYHLVVKVMPSIVAFVLNIVSLAGLVYFGIIQKELLSFILASLVTSIVFIFIDKIYLHLR